MERIMYATLKPSMRQIMYKTFALMIGLITVFAAANAVPAAEWGSLKGKFVVDGTAPTPTPVKVTKDQDYCGKHNLVEETVVVGKNGELKNAVVYLRPGLGKKVDINPTLEAKLKEPVILDNRFCRFEPHIVLIRLGQTLTIKNSDPDPVGHNTKIDLFGFNRTIGSKSQEQVVANKDFVLPMPVNCSIHPWMAAHILSLNHPYMAASQDDGTFEIKDIPAGTSEFQFWHEAKGNLKNLKVGSGGMTDAKGRAKLKIEAGKTLDLGEIKVPASMLK
jgi:hypothetical protein